MAGDVEPLPASEQLTRWRDSDADKTLGGLVEALGTGGFGVIFLILLGVPALPLPTGGITHVFEVVAMLIALQLIFGRRSVWIPRRWHGVSFSDRRGAKFIDGLITTTTKLERFSKPRMRWIFGHWWSHTLYGLGVLVGALAAFLAPPFTGLDTVPSLGVVILSVGVIVEDVAYMVAGTLLILVAPVLEITLGDAILRWVRGLF
jgi:hypothetical protein